MLCTVDIEVNDTDDAIAFLNCINQLSYIDIKSIKVKERSDGDQDKDI